MAEAIGVASSIAGLVALAAQIAKLSYGYVQGVKNAPRTQKRYLQEVSAFMDVLLRLEESCQDAEVLSLAVARPASLSPSAIEECRAELKALQNLLERCFSARLLWPLYEKDLKCHIDGLHRFRLLFSDFLSANIL
jgi:hypothetical protein